MDNVLAVAGAAREHPAVLVLGLLLSIVLMGLAANALAGLLQRHVWIGFVGLAIILYVALHMVWQGGRDLTADMRQVRAHDTAVSTLVRIAPGFPRPARLEELAVVLYQHRSSAPGQSHVRQG